MKPMRPNLLQLERQPVQDRIGTAQQAIWKMKRCHGDVPARLLHVVGRVDGLRVDGRGHRLREMLAEK